MNLDEAKLKIAKLLRLGENQGANNNEAETAIRQAEALMRKYNVTHTEVLEKGGEIFYKWESGFFGFGRDGKPVQRNPIWFQWVCVEVAKFTDTIVTNDYHHEDGAGVRFKGEAEDVILALWFADYLKDAIRKATREADMGSPQEREAFRKSMSLRLCSRLRELRELRQRDFSTGTALVVVSDKLAKRNEYFGGESYKVGRAVKISHNGAILKGYEAANKVPLNKPLSGTVKKQISRV